MSETKTQVPKEPMKENKMGVMPVNKLLVNMALPMVASMFVQACYNIVDSIFVARISENATRTMTDGAIGSVHYISPEQAKGSLTDSRTDLYAAGVILYEMLTGKLPFQSDNAVSVLK